MQDNEAINLSRQWKGGKCIHSHIEAEFHLGSRTGDYVCTTCGEARAGKGWNKFVVQVEPSNRLSSNKGTRK